MDIDRDTVDRQRCRKRQMDIERDTVDRQRCRKRQMDIERSVESPAYFG